jgi:hypothetical protein
MGVKHDIRRTIMLHKCRKSHHTLRRGTVSHGLGENKYLKVIKKVALPNSTVSRRTVILN